MHRIFRTSLFPRVGNLDMVHSYLVNMLLLCMEFKGTTQTLDVCDIMWEELYLAVLERKVPIYGPCLQVLIEITWEAHFVDERLPVGPLTSHEVVQMRIKENWDGGLVVVLLLQPALMRRLLRRLLQVGARFPVLAPMPGMAVVLGLLLGTLSSLGELLSSLGR